MKRKGKPKPPKAPPKAAAVEPSDHDPQGSMGSCQLFTTRSNRSLPALIALIAFAGFLPALQNGFVDPDAKVLAENSSYGQSGWGALQGIFTDLHFGQYQPLTWLTFALDYGLWWSDPFGYHLTSVVLHVGNTVLFYFLALRLIVLAIPFGSLSDERAQKLAGFAALVAALHPLRVETVAWASARAELVTALLFLFSLQFYLRAAGAGDDRRSPRLWTLLSVASYAGCLLAGPGGILLPLVLCALDYYPLKRFANLPSDSSLLRRLCWEKAPYLLTSVVLVALVLIRREVAETAPPTGAPVRLLTLLGAPGFHLGKLVWPMGLAPAYEPDTALLWFLAVSGTLTCCLVAVFRKRWPTLWAALVCYAGLSLPILRGDPQANQLLADRYAYVAAFAPILLASGALVSFAQLSRASVGRPKLLAGGAFATAIVLCLGTLTWKDIGKWENAEVLWQTTVHNNPTSQAHFNLAGLFEAQGKHDQAIARYRKAAALHPRRWDAHERAAALLQRRGNMAEAVEHYQVVVQLNPSSADARENLAGGLVNQGRIEEAVQHFRKLLDLAPERNEARFKLGTILALKGRVAEAAQILRQAAAVDPEDARILLRLGQVLAAQGQFGDAVNYLRQAVSHGNKDAEAHESLGRALLEIGQKSEATRHLQEAIQILRSRPASN